MTGRIWLGRPGLEALLPHLNRKYSEQDVEYSRENQTASGRRVKDYIATKKVFTINYSTISNNDILALKSIYEIKNSMSLKIENSDGTISTYMVRMKPFARERLIIAMKWYWSGISIVLEEI